MRKILTTQHPKYFIVFIVLAIYSFIILLPIANDTKWDKDLKIPQIQTKQSEMINLNFDKITTLVLNK